jgi:RNA polymerase sigma-54 factor
MRFAERRDEEPHRDVTGGAAVNGIDVTAMRSSLGSSAPETIGVAMDASLRMELRPSALLVASMQLLGASSAELELIVERELSANAALERIEPVSDAGTATVDWPAEACRRPAPQGDRASDSLADLPGRRSDQDRLVDETRPLVADEDRFVLEYLVHSLDARGFLDQEIGEIANRLGISSDRVERVLAAVRTSSPPGLGARNVTECLLLQLDHLAATGAPVPAHCRPIVERHLDALARGRVAAVADALTTSERSVFEVRTFLRNHLRPYVAWEPDRSPCEAQVEVRLIVPDLVVREDPTEPGGLDVEVAEASRLVLRVDPAYTAAIAERRPLSDRERGHVRSHVRRARFFLARLNERWATLRRVGECTFARQRRFILHGPAALEPLTRADVARELCIHESTVSRATAEKYVMLPSGRVVPFSDFFDRSLPARDQLRELIRDETRPLSDAELARAMRDRGFPVARRTVTKYRQRLDVLPASLR